VDGQGIPLGGQITSASPGEVTLVESTLATIRVPRKGGGRPKSKPERLIGDKAYDSDKLRDTLKRRGIDMIAPNRRSRKRKTQDGRKLRRYRRRWRVERTIAWLQNFRRLAVRYENHVRLYRAFFHLACLIITLRHL